VARSCTRGLERLRLLRRHAWIDALQAAFEVKYDEMPRLIRLSSGSIGPRAIAIPHIPFVAGSRAASLRLYANAGPVSHDEAPAGLDTGRCCIHAAMSSRRSCRAARNRPAARATSKAGASSQMSRARVVGSD
jgi:hypothetical protein